MNWGTKLIIALGLFMSFIIVLSTRMIFSDKDDLVEKDYYEKGLAYDEVYEKTSNVERDQALPVISKGVDKDISILFKRQATGIAKFQHASNRQLDRIYKIQTGENGEARLSLKDLQSGYWHLELDWKSDTTSYIYKDKLHI